MDKSVRTETDKGRQFNANKELGRSASSVECGAKVPKPIGDLSCVGRIAKRGKIVLDYVLGKVRARNE
jgi:hypothetical protein